MEADLLHNHNQRISQVRPGIVALRMIWFKDPLIV